MCGDGCDRKECACVVIGVRGRKECACVMISVRRRKECACVVMGVTGMSVHVW